MSDDAMVRGLIDGDEAVYSQLIDRLYPGMHRLVLAYVRDGDVADDVIQDTWLAVIAGIGRFEGRSALRTWIYSIAQNLARKRAARDARFVGIEQLAEHAEAHAPSAGPVLSLEKWGPGQNPDDWVVTNDVVARVEAAIAALPAMQASVITLRDIQGWSAGEVCELLEISPANQRVILHRARTAVRNAIGHLMVDTHDERSHILR